MPLNNCCRANTSIAIAKCAGVIISQLGIAMNIDPRSTSKMSACVMDIQIPLKLPRANPISLVLLILDKFHRISQTQKTTMTITIKISLDHQKGVNVSAPQDINIQIVGNEDEKSPRSPTQNLRWGSLSSPSTSAETAPSTQSEKHSNASPASATGSWGWPGEWTAHEDTESNADDDKSVIHHTNEDEWKWDSSDGKNDTDEEKDSTSTISSELNSFEGKVHSLKRLAAEFKATCSKLEAMERSEAPDLTECERCCKYEDRIRNRTGVIVDLGKIRQMVRETLEEEKLKTAEW